MKPQIRGDQIIVEVQANWTLHFIWLNEVQQLSGLFSIETVNHINL